MNQRLIACTLSLGVFLGLYWPLVGQVTITPALYVNGAGTSIGSITFPTATGIRTGTTAADTLLLQAYDTDTGPGYVTLATLTAGTAPTIAIPVLTSPLTLSGNVTQAAWTTTGPALNIAAATFTDSTTAAAGTVAVRTANSLGAPTFAFSHGGANATITDAFTLYVPKPIAGTGAAITNANSAYFEGPVGVGLYPGGYSMRVSSMATKTGGVGSTAANGLAVSTTDASSPLVLAMVVADNPFERGIIYSYEGGYQPTIFEGNANFMFAYQAASTPPQKVTVVGALGVYNNYTASNYEGLTITPTAGNVTFAAVTAGTGTDNINLVMTPAGTGTTIVSTGLHVGGTGAVADNNLEVDGTATITGAIYPASYTGDLKPTTTNAYDISGGGLQWRNLVLTGTLTVSSAGPHAIGGVSDTQNGLSILSAFTSSALYARGVLINPSVSAGAANGQSFVFDVAGTLVEYGSGAHALMAGSRFQSPIITAGVATVSNTATVYITAAPAATVTGANYALWSAAGLNRFGGAVRLDSGITGGCTGTPTVATSGVATTCTGPEYSPEALMAEIRSMQAQLAALQAGVR